MLSGLENRRPQRLTENIFQAETRMDRGFTADEAIIFGFFQKKFKKSLKFPKTAPLPVSRRASKGLLAGLSRVKEFENIFKYFRQNPKVPQNAAVKESDVAKKRRRNVIILCSRKQVFEAQRPTKIHAARASILDLRVFVRQTPTGRIRYFLTKNTEGRLFSYFCCSRRMYLTGNAKRFPSDDNGFKEMEMTANDMMAEIRDANLSYLMLAQQMIRADKVTAIFRLGISGDIAELIEGMSNAQILKLAGGNMMLARFRFDDGAILSMLTNYNKDRVLAQSHAAILMAGQAVEEIV